VICVTDRLYETRKLESFAGKDAGYVSRLHFGPADAAPGWHAGLRRIFCASARPAAPDALRWSSFLLYQPFAGNGSRSALDAEPAWLAGRPQLWRPFRGAAQLELWNWLRGRYLVPAYAICLQHSAPHLISSIVLCSFPIREP